MKIKLKAASGLSLCLSALALVTVAAASSKGSFGDDPSQWTGHDVYEILNDSPWSRVVKVDLSHTGSLNLGDDSPAGGSVANTTPMPTAGGMGRRGMGRTTGTYSSGSRPSSTPSNSKPGPTQVTVQWQSALVVQMAAAKKAGDAADPASFKPMNEYVIALIGLPITAVGGPAASADSANTVSQEQQERIEEHVKSSASIVRSGHEALTPTKVELDQGADGRMLIHFPKSAPITASEGSVEFRLVMGKSQLRKKFPLKEMEFQGKLSL